MGKPTYTKKKKEKQQQQEWVTLLKCGKLLQLGDRRLWQHFHAF